MGRGNSIHKVTEAGNTLPEIKNDHTLLEENIKERPGEDKARLIDEDQIMVSPGFQTEDSEC